MFAKPYAGPATADIRMTLLVGSSQVRSIIRATPQKIHRGARSPESGREAGAAS